MDRSGSKTKTKTKKRAKVKVKAKTKAQTTPTTVTAKTKTKTSKTKTVRIVENNNVNENNVNENNVNENNVNENNVGAISVPGLSNSTSPQRSKSDCSVVLKPNNKPTPPKPRRSSFPEAKTRWTRVLNLVKKPGGGKDGDGYGVDDDGFHRLIDSHRINIVMPGSPGSGSVTPSSVRKRFNPILEPIIEVRGASVDYSPRSTLLGVEDTRIINGGNTKKRSSKSWRSAFLFSHDFARFMQQQKTVPNSASTHGVPYGGGRMTQAHTFTKHDDRTITIKGVNGDKTKRAYMLRQKPCQPIDMLNWDDSLFWSRRIEAEKLQMETRRQEMEQQRDESLRQRRNVRIIVIGAGLAGLSAADELLGCGFKHVTVFEASSRLGGRVHTICNPDDPNDVIEMGVSDVDHLKEWNSVYKFAIDNNLLHSANTVQMKLAPIRRRWMHPDRYCDLDCRDAFNTYSRVLDSNIDAIRQLKNNSSDNPDCNIKLSTIDFFRESLRKLKYNRNSSVHLQHVLGPHSMGVANSLRAYCKELQYYHGDDLGEADIGRFGIWRSFAFSTLPNGMQSLLKPLTKRFKPNTVKFKAKATRIDWHCYAGCVVSEGRCGRSSLENKKVADDPVNCDGSRPMISVTCNDGKTYRADHVIVAVPLGHLKTAAKTMFAPSLPEEKITAINEMGFGAVGKVFLHFQDPVDAKGFDFLWTRGCENRSSKSSSMNMDLQEEESSSSTEFSGSSTNSSSTITSEANGYVMKVEKRGESHGEKHHHHHHRHHDDDNDNAKKSVSTITPSFKLSEKLRQYYGSSKSSRMVGGENYNKSIEEMAITFSSRANSRVVQVTFNDADIEKMNNHDLERELTPILSRLLTRELPSAIKVTKTNWKKDALFGGTHPYIRVGGNSSSEKLLDVLSQPIMFRGRPVIQFAGDYTYPDQSCLQHAARASGIGEALTLNHFYDPNFGQDNVNVSSRG